MTKKLKQDPAVTSLQKFLTLGMLVFVAYLVVSQDREMAEVENSKTEPVRVQITDTKSGAISFSDLRAGKVIIGKWEVELAPEPEVAPEEAPVAEAAPAEEIPTIEPSKVQTLPTNGQ